MVQYESLFLLFMFFFMNFNSSVFIIGESGPLYNMVHNNMVLDITLIIVGHQMVIFDYFCYMSIYFTLILTQIG